MTHHVQIVELNAAMSVVVRVMMEMVQRKVVLSVITAAEVVVVQVVPSRHTFK